MTVTVRNRTRRIPVKQAVRWAVIAGSIMLGSGAGAVNNSNPVDLEVFVQISSNLVISVTSATSYDFGVVAGSAVVVSGTTFDIRNTGAGLSQRYQLRASNTANWTLGAAPGADTFSLDAQFNGPAVPGSWSALHRLTASYVSSDALVFAGNQNGLSTPTGSVRSLWTRISTPTSTGAAARQRIQLDVNAITP